MLYSPIHDASSAIPHQQSSCCGHSEAPTAAYVRFRCSDCGQVVARAELSLDESGLRHQHDGEPCGPVREERARSHAEYVAWLVEAARQRQKR